MKGEVGSCGHPPISVSRKWETTKPRPTAPERGAQKAKEAKTRSELHRIIAILHKWGIHSLGQLAALDKEQIANRLGPEAVRMWERAHGTSTRLLKLVQPPESFTETFEFENEIETVEPLLFILRRFLQQLSLRLGALYLVTKELKLRITFSDKTFYEHLFEIPEPSNKEEVLFRMLHAHLESFTSAAPIIEVSLDAKATKPAQQQFSLFESALRDPTQLSETLTRLTGLLGRDRVGTPVLEETHRPDAFRMEAFSWQLPEHSQPNERRACFALRRFRSATSAAVLLGENTPVHFRGAEIHGEVVQKNGPFTASGNWWDENAWRRAEWDLQIESGAVCRCHANGETWQLDGIYD